MATMAGMENNTKNEPLDLVLRVRIGENLKSFADGHAASKGMTTSELVRDLLEKCREP